MFEANYASLEDVPEAFRDHYAEINGRSGFHIDVKGGLKTNDDIARLNAALGKEREEHKGAKKKLKSFGDHTPETIEALVTESGEFKIKLEGLEGEAEGGMEKIAELVEHRVNAAIAPMKRENERLTSELSETGVERDSLKTDRDRGMITAAVRTAATEANVNKFALESDVPGWAMENFEIADGKVVSKDGLPAKDVLLDLKGSGTRPHWFGETISAEAVDGKGASLQQNPFDREGKHFNMSEGMALVKTNPQLAARLAKAANFKI